MIITPTNIPDVLLLKPKVFYDTRGYFFETFRDDIATEYFNGIKFLQDNESESTFGTLRGLHYQLSPFAQSKLVRVVQGKIYDIAVDIRKDSASFGKYIAVELSSKNKHQLFIPQGFAHGFIVLSEKAIVNYKVDNYYSPKHDRGIKYNDEDLAIDWQLDESQFCISDKDKNLPSLKDAEVFEVKEPA